jgi:TolB-like protein
MRNPLIIQVYLSICLCLSALAQAPDIDKELGTLADKLNASIRENGKKKVAVADFTDLQGTPQGELGRYIAEQLTVNLVMNKKDFTVLDRANLKRILAEHKLTSTGLVDPENAKKIGQFAGVDAFIMGTIVTKSNSVNLTAKVITTDTAEVVGAARGEFASDETVKQLVSKPAVPSESEPAKKQVSLASKQFGNVNVVVEGLRKLDYEMVQVDLIMQNKNTKESVAVALYHEACFVAPCTIRGSLTAADGTQFYSDSSAITGIRSMEITPDGLTEIEPNGEQKVSIIFRPQRNPARRVTSYRLQLDIVINQSYKASAYDNYRLPRQGLPPFCRISNLVLDIPTP